MTRSASVPNYQEAFTDDEDNLMELDEIGAARSRKAPVRKTKTRAVNKARTTKTKTGRKLRSVDIEIDVINE